jgi:hypothetical protein
MSGHGRVRPVVLAAAVVVAVGALAPAATAAPGHAGSGSPALPRQAVPAAAGEPAGSATGPAGQRLTVTPANGLDPVGTTVRVVGEGYDRSVGIYVALCVDRGAGVAPSPCFGGADTTGASRSTVWISDNPPPYAVGLTKPFGPGGTFDVELWIAARQDDDAGNPILDCLDGVTRCVIATRADHTRPTDRSADVKVPVVFGTDTGGEPVPEPPEAPEPAVTLDRTVVAPGDTFVVSGSGFLPGEQVELTLHSEPTWLATPLSDTAGGFAATVTVPTGTAPGEHHVEARGVTSGRTARSGPLQVVAATPEFTPTVEGESTPTGAALVAPPAPLPEQTATPSRGTLPATGMREDLARLGVALVTAGALLVALGRAGTRHRTRAAHGPQTTPAPPG